MDIRLQYTDIAVGDIAAVEEILGKAIESAKTMKRRIQYGSIACMIVAAWQGKCEQEGAYKGMDWAEVACIKANYLVNEVGSGVHGAALVKYLVFQCGFKINEAAKKEGFVDVANKAWICEHLEAAKAKPWFDYKAPNPFKGFDMMEDLRKLINKSDTMAATADADKKKAKTIEVDRDMLEVLHSLIAGKPVTHKNALQLIQKLTPDPEDLEEEEESAGTEVPMVAQVA